MSFAEGEFPVEAPKRKERHDDVLYTVNGDRRYWSSRTNKWLCIHKRVRQQCKQCHGTSICSHGFRKANCRACGGSEICCHGKFKRLCKQCKGTALCIHGTIRSICIPCDGGAICEHRKIRSRCRLCHGGSICVHHKRRSQCCICEGGEMCVHKKLRYQCLACGGKKMCHHGKQRDSCKECSSRRLCILCKSTFATGPLKPHCAPCFYHLNPDVPQAKRFLTKQKYLRKHLIDEVRHPFISDVSVNGGCSRRKPDFAFECLTHSVILENDEYQHRYTGCEEKRVMELFQDLGNRPMIMLRFNPDGYRDIRNIRVSGCFERNKRGTLDINEQEWTRRWIVLKDRLLYSIQNIPSKEVTIEYLFYNENTQDESKEEEEKEDTEMD